MQKEEYINVTPERLIEDQFFLDWVLRQQPEAKAFWEEFMRTYPQEKKAVLQARDFVHSLHRTLSEEPIDEFDTQKLWERIEANTTTEIRVFPLGKWIAAASILLVLCIFFLFPKGSKIIKTDWGETVQVELPDASKVIINSASQISYSTLKWKDERNIRLNGEAFFEVTPGQKFTVATPHGSIEVLGTSFNIQARDLLTVVDCFSGKVAVMDQNRKRKTLLPGQKIMIKASGLSDVEQSKNQENAIAWRSGMVYLRQATLQTAIRELQWYYPIEIQADEAILSRPIEGFFKTSHLDSALYQITTPLNLEFEIQSNGVVLIKEK